MALSLLEVKKLSTISLDLYEIRGAKYGINNAQSTGPMYVHGSYVPSSNILYCDGSFTDSSVIVGVQFRPPYASFTADRFLAGDTIQVDGSNLSVVSSDSTSVTLSSNVSLSVTKDFTGTWGFREYLIEPDTALNTYSEGKAIFTKGISTVMGVDTTWSSHLAAGDFIKPDAYQKNFTVQSVTSDTILVMTSSYDTTGPYMTPEPYTAKMRRLGRISVQYTKDDFHYEKNGGTWVKNDGTDGHIIANAFFTTLADGVQVEFTPALSTDEPDLMEYAQVLGKVFAQKTQREMPQFPLPVVPYPESSLKLMVNDIAIDRFPDGNKDYVVSYWQDPIYLPPPAPVDRKVANLMFLKDTGVQTLAPASTAQGIISFTDPTGNQYTGLMPRSERVLFDGADQTRFVDYVFDSDSGTAYTTVVNRDETVVGPIFIDYSYLIDYGIHFTLDGKPLVYFVPFRTTDDVRISLESGRFKPSNSDHPGVGEEYRIAYMVDSDYVSKEAVPVTAGMSSFRTLKFPIKGSSFILSKNGVVLEENTDYRVSYQTGRVVLFSPLSATDTVTIDYNPLSIQVNGMSYSDGSSWCTTYDARLSVKSASSMSMTLLNANLTPTDASFFSIYNETRGREYNLTRLASDKDSVTLAKDSTNLAIGMGSSDLIVADYRFASEVTEYSPIVVNNFVVGQDSTGFSIPAVDATSYFIPGAVVSLTPSDSAQSNTHVVSWSSYDGEDTFVSFTGSVPEDIVNPSILATDSSVAFYPIGATSPVTAGSNVVVLPGVNTPNQFRAGTLLNVSGDAYVVSGASFDGTDTLVTLSSKITNVTEKKNFVSPAASLSSTPVYPEGATVIVPSSPVVTDPALPGILLNFDAAQGGHSGSVYASVTSTAMSLITDTVTYRFDYSGYPTLGDMSSGLGIVSGLSAVAYHPSWLSGKLTPTATPVFIGTDSSTLLTAGPALRIDGTDSTSFSIVDGEVVLTTGLIKGQKINLDYQGLRYLDGTTVSFEANYFVNLPAGSKVSASFQFSNLDQFYIQAVSRRWFLENVTQPRAKQESQQQGGNVGQGGTVPDDSDQGNMDGGLTGDEYRRQDTEIECHMFKGIFDGFNNRLQAISDERSNAIGLTCCNNDGLLSLADGSNSTKAFNRMFPTSDYTGLSPFQITPLTGQVRGPGMAIFTNGDATIRGLGTKWSQQIVHSGLFPTDGTYYIRQATALYDSTVRYVVDTTTVVLNQAFDGTTTTASSGESYVLTSPYPIFDDDGNCGAKITGVTMGGSLGLANNDVFDATVFAVSPLSGPRTVTNLSCVFKDPTDILSLLLNPLSSLDMGKAATILNSSFTGVLTATLEHVFTSSSTWGYRDAIVLRTDSTFNKVILGNGKAISKLGFVPGTTAWGNLDRTDSSSECVWDQVERNGLVIEKGNLGAIISFGPTKLDRTNAPQLNLLQSSWSSQSTAMANEQAKINKELGAASYLTLETYPSYGDTTAKAKVSIANSMQFQTDTSHEQSYVGSLITNWNGHPDSSKWAIDYSSSLQIIKGVVTATGVGVDHTGAGVTPIAGYTSPFYLLDPVSAYDTRILNLPTDTPKGTYVLGGTVDGSWSGWQLPTPVFGRYSIKNDATFAFSSVGMFTVSLDGVAPNPTYTTGVGDITLNWTKASGPVSATFAYSTYKNIGQVTGGITGTEGFGAYPLYSISSYDYTNLTTAGPVSIPAYPGVTVYLGTSSPALWVYSTDATLAYSIDATALNLSWDATGTTLRFTDYPTLSQIRSAINGVPGFTSRTDFDVTYPYGGLRPASGALASVSPGTALYFDTIGHPVAAFKVFFGMANYRYSVDTTSITILWDEDTTTASKLFNYGSYATVGAVKTGIDAITGLAVAGSPIYDSSAPSFKIASGAISPSAIIYSGLRDMYVNYQTISDRNLTDRTNDISNRDSTLASRMSYLIGTRDFEFPAAAPLEQLLRWADGGQGNLYYWADKRYNRRQGCDARLSQIEKQMEANRSSLSVNKGLI